MLINNLANNSYDLIAKKAFEISYALCRVSQAIKNDSFKKIFDEQGLKILNLATIKDIEAIKQTIFSIEYFIHLARSLNLFRNDLADAIIAELNNLNNFIAEYLKNIENENMIDINSIFKTKLNIDNKKDKLIKKSKINIKDNSAIENNLSIDNSAIDNDLILNSSINNSAVELGSAIKDSAIENNNSATNMDSAINNNEEKQESLPNQADNKSKTGFLHISEIINNEKESDFKKTKENNTNNEMSVRKSVFFDKIRYFQEFKLRDLEEIFPELSERTIRYYLSDLINKGIIEKRGSSGPNVLYKVKNPQNIQVFEEV
ncbi:MAG: hypothetical protein NZ484_00230 [Patescibacteria group bacterium]|nr:hypothetical protein [Patescibacteria group bacterium]MDW8279606.1 hypothetical protein [bacterium]